MSAAWRMVAQSDWLPMMMATGVLAIWLGSFEKKRLEIDEAERKGKLNLYFLRSGGRGASQAIMSGVSRSSRKVSRSRSTSLRFFSRWICN